MSKIFVLTLAIITLMTVNCFNIEKSVQEKSIYEVLGEEYRCGELSDHEYTIITNKAIEIAKNKRPEFKENAVYWNQMIKSALGGNWVTFISKTFSEDFGLDVGGELSTKKCWMGMNWGPEKWFYYVAKSC